MTNDVVPRIIDEMIRKGAVLPDHRALAIEVLDREMRRKTTRLLESMSNVAVKAAGLRTCLA
jgi:hypothetical protein